MSAARAAATAAAVAVVVAVMALIGFAGVNIALAAVTTAALGTLLGHRDLGRDVTLPGLRDAERSGHRHEAARISWSLTDADGRVSEHGLRELRAVAAGRLRTAGIDPSDATAARAAVGERAWTTLTASSPPTVRALDACLTALENLEPRR
ncbi:hypothetical protein FE251_04135 [Georgenia wutianyii]|uniref:Uncharacterized protein n=1 Tax=Georgenia wutianyii TaxID=2585135 RepID=A0ABX5VJP6_9MICO|nr:hypothetical protein [Georgenia wutianyii]QDB78657.1 hypothetical protein FE251_04135 [Georgenia wutianyii]